MRLDLSGSGTILLHVIWSQTPAERWRLAIAAPHMLPSAHTTASASTTSSFRGSIPYPMQSLCTLRTPRCRDARNTRYRAARYALPGRDLHPLDHANFPGAPCGDPIKGSTAGAELNSDNGHQKPKQNPPCPLDLGDNRLQETRPVAGQDV